MTNEADLINRAEAALIALTDQCAGSCAFEPCLCEKIWPSIEAIRAARQDEAAS